MTQKLQTSAIPIDLAERQGSTKINTRFIVGGILLLCLVGYLVFQMIQATSTTGAYFMTVDELLSTPNVVGQRIRVSGNVVPGSEDWNAQEITLRFVISDQSFDQGNGVAEGAQANAVAASDDIQQVPIVFYGPRPDNFQRAASAIIEGEMQADGTFLADTLLLKCPSRYEEEPTEIYAESTR
jgi:cytochrome c-type biogenesis protein CcmE